MSISNRGQGDIALSVYNHFHNLKPRRPYLRRNVRAVLSCLTSGPLASKLVPSVAAESREESMDSEEEEEEEEKEPPKKRRKMLDIRAKGSDEGEFWEPFSQVTGESHRFPSSKPESIKQTTSILVSEIPVAAAKRYQRPLDRILPKSSIEFHESMRVDIHQINPTFDEIVTEDLGAVATIPCRCSVAIRYAKNDDDPGDVVKRTDYVEICKLVKECMLKISISRDGRVSRETIFSEPFVFSSNHFYVSRRTRKSIGQWDSNSRIFGFADKYLSVELESKGYHVTWPPLLNQGVVSDLIDGGDIAPEDTSLRCWMNPWASPDRHASVELYLYHKRQRQSLPYTVNTKVRWAIPSQFNGAKSTKVELNRAVAEVEALKAPQPGGNCEVPEASKSPVPRQDENIKAQESPGKIRVSRHRNFPKPLYNLKALSSIAQGKYPKATHTNGLELHDHDDGKITITYSFGKADAAEPGIKRETTITGFKCPFCLARNRTLDELRLHLHTDHGTYKFQLRKANSPRVAYFIELSKKNSPSPAFPAELQRTIQLGRPNRLFDLNKHLSGDESWIKARNGPLNNQILVHFHSRAFGSSLSSSPYKSRHSSPNTSNAEDATMDEFYELQCKPSIKQRKIFYAPKVAKPLYDTITKRLLRTGDQLADEDEETDEAWLHLKQKDAINDFEEAVVLPEEKEFINCWNPFVVSHHLTSDKQLQPVFVRFVERNKTWLAEKRARMMELMKHAHNLVMKRVIDERCLQRCVNLVSAEMKVLATRDDKDGELDFVADGPTAQRLGTCICGEFQPVSAIVCRGTNCKTLLFCRPCAKKAGRSVMKAWKCDACFSRS